jgi:hypothetical protein
MSRPSRLPAASPDARCRHRDRDLHVTTNSLGPARPVMGQIAGECGCGPIDPLRVQLLRLRGAMTNIAHDQLPHWVSAAEVMGATEPRLVK